MVLFAAKADARGRIRGANGYYKDGKLWIDVNAGKLTAGDVSGFLRTVAHELTHFGKEYSPAFYEDLKRFAFAVLGEKRGPDAFDNYVARKLERDRTGRLTVVDAEEEIIADACETMLRNSEVVRQALERDRKPVERVIRKRYPRLFQTPCRSRAARRGKGFRGVHRQAERAPTAVGPHDPRRRRGAPGDRRYKKHRPRGRGGNNSIV